MWFCGFSKLYLRREKVKEIVVKLFLATKFVVTYLVFKMIQPFIIPQSRCNRSLYSLHTHQIYNRGIFGTYY